MKTHKKRVLAVALIVAVIISIVPAGAAPMASVGDVLFNGGFEHGFLANSVCGGMVGKGWGCFTNGGTAAYGFYDDMWEPVVYAGTHSQLIEINTKEKGGDGGRNAGIFQVVEVWPGSEYELSLKGMIRADDHGGDPWRYRVYVGFDYYGGTDWQAVTDWRELPWDTYYDRLNPGEFSSYSTKVKPHTGKMTVFVRTERKWGTWYEETDFNLDAISLYGPVPHKAVPYDKDKHGYYPQPEKPAHPVYPVKPVHPIEPPKPVHPIEPPTPELVCDGPNVLWNGNFEYGFQSNGVANYWVGFNNGGNVNYGYYDEMWERVVSEGEHGQLLEINTLDVGDQTQENRISGIYQKVWLKPGATYEISLDALMRERNDHSDEDFYRYMVEWGLSKNGGIDPSKMSHWERVPLEEIYLRTDPGPMQSYSARFTAPSELTTIWLFAIKKWATLERELDVNLDNVSVRLCRTTKPVYPVHPIYPPKPTYPVYPPKPVHPIEPPKPVHPIEPPPGQCSVSGETAYVVQRGDTLSAIAQQFGITVQEIMLANGLSNPNVIFAGQVLCIPGVTAYAKPQPAAPVTAPPPAAPSTDEPTLPAVPDGTHRVQRGETLSGIAAQYGTSVEAIMAANGLTNPNVIYAGQFLVIPTG